MAKRVEHRGTLPYCYPERLWTPRVLATSLVKLLNLLVDQPGQIWALGNQDFPATYQGPLARPDIHSPEVAARADIIGGSESGPTANVVRNSVARYAPTLCQVTTAFTLRPETMAGSTVERINLSPSTRTLRL